MNSIAVPPSDGGVAALPPSTVELNLLLAWPGERNRSYWLWILAGSVALHFFVLVGGAKVPGLLGYARHPERQIVYRHIPLYLPPDVMTQKAPNKQKVAKEIDLADLVESKQTQPNPGERRPSVRHFEIPKQTPMRQLARNSQPQILPQAPTVDPNQNAAAPGLPDGLPATAPPPPTDNPGPFQNIGSDAPLNPHPKLLPPRGGIDAAVNKPTHDSNGPQFSISDDAPEQMMPGNLGTLSQAPAQHAAVELESDPNGADFKVYLRTILGIVRGNWRRVIPESARMGALRGRTVVEFIINRDGSIPKLVTADPSGHDPLDRAAVAGLSMSNPLPPLPADYKGFQIRLAFTFAYNMPAK